MQSSWRADWLATVIQGIPRLAVLSRHMVPTLQIDSVASLEPGTLASLDVCGVIWDIDGTLMQYHGRAVAPQLADAFQRLCADPNLRHVILSNCDERRFVELAEIFPTIPVLRIYEGPDGLSVRRRIGSADSFLGDDDVPHRPGTRTLRKPNVSLIRAALDELGCSAPSNAVMVGDQYITDVAPADIVGVRTVKVRTVQPRSFPMAVRVLQVAERILYKLSPSR